MFAASCVEITRRAGRHASNAHHIATARIVGISVKKVHSTKACSSASAALKRFATPKSSHASFVSAVSAVASCASATGRKGQAKKLRKAHTKARKASPSKKRQSENKKRRL